MCRNKMYCPERYLLSFQDSMMMGIGQKTSKIVQKGQIGGKRIPHKRSSIKITFLLLAKFWQIVSGRYKYYHIY